MQTRSTVFTSAPVLLVLFLYAYVPAARAEEAAPTAHWKFEGDLADAQGKLNGEFKGGQPTFVDGPAGGKALALAKGQFVTFGPAEALDLDKCTVELCFRLQTPPGTFKYNPCLIAKRSNEGGHSATRFSIHVWNDHKQLALWNGQSVVRYEVPGQPLQAGQWHHLAVAFDGAATRLYLDGVPCPSDSTAAFNVQQRKLPLQLGASDPRGAENLPGAYDELAVYAQALTAEQVAARADALGFKQQRETLLAAAREREERLRKEQQERQARHAARIAEMKKDPALTAPGARRVYSGDRLTGISMPLGGIAAGPIQIDGRAMRPIWQIFNNYKAVDLADTFFAACVKAGDGKPVLRALQTEPVGPFQAVKALTFSGEYPFGWFEFTDADLPVRLSMECCSILIPLNARDSAFPAAVFRLTARNLRDAPVTVTFLASQQNPVGNPLSGPRAADRTMKGYGQNVNSVVRRAGWTRIHMTGKAGTGPSCGDMVLAADAEDARAAASWETLQALADTLAGGTLGGEDKAGPSEDGRTLNGALAVPLTLGPGETKSVRFVLAWHFPNVKQPWVGGQGNRYAAWWPDAMSVTDEFTRRLDELTEQTRAYHDALYDSNLPVWLLDRVSSQVAILASRTCFWSRDGYFGGWEGCNPDAGCCAGNCGHVWHYAQAHARLWPEIARRMREQALRHQRADGALFFRQPATGVAADAQAGEILEAYREHLACTDNDWLKANWPRIRKAMEYMIAVWDADEDGMMSGRWHNTLDVDSSGCSSWVGSLYAAALDAAGRMAAIATDAEAATRFGRIAQAARKNQNEKLFNGEYYIQIPDAKPLRDYFNGCSIDQVLGCWWADQLDLAPVYPADRVRSAMAALVRLNFRPDFHGIRQAPRKFVHDDDAGTQMVQWPGDKRPPNHILYADEAMTGFEYAAAGAMMQVGMVDDALLLTKAVSDRYDGRLRTTLSGGAYTSWGFSGNPFGDDECGKFYARAMSSWSLLLAAQGFIHDGPAGVIGFQPRWQAENHRSFFIGAEGYGTFSQTIADGKQTASIALRRGKLTLRTVVLQAPEGAKAAAALVRCAGKDLKARSSQEGRRVTVSLDAPLTVGQAQGIQVELSLQK